MTSRRAVKIMLWSMLAVTAAFVAIDHAGAFGYRGDDRARFDHQSVVATRVISGDEFIIENGTTIRLVGVDAPDPPLMHGATEATEYLTARLSNRSVTLRLDGTQTRDENGALRAYVYVTDGDCLNVDIVRDGKAFADRRTKHTLRGPIEQAEAEARKRQRGMWKALADDQQPAWRQEWLRNRRR